MTTLSSNRIRSLAWEDEAPSESRPRRVPQSVPPQSRTLPGMPLEMEEPDGDDSLRPDSLSVDGSVRGSSRRGSSGRDWPERPWWRPASKVGRVFLIMAALAVMGGLATSAYHLKSYVGRDARYRIGGARNIEATGLTEVSRAEMLPVFGEDIGRNVFFVPLGERRRQLEEIPWIEKATVMRLLPDQIRVSVVERQPVAFVRQGQQISLVDANGVLLTMPAAMMAQRHYSFPVVTGIDTRDPLPTRKARMAVYQRLLAELDSSGQKLSSQISEVDLTDPQDARVFMQDDTPLLHFGEDHFLERYQRYKAHINEWRQQYPKLTAVDLRYEQQVVLEMASGTNVAQASADQQTAADAAQEKQPVLQAADKGQIAGKFPDKQHAGVKDRMKHAPQPIARIKPAKAGTKTAGKGPAKAKAIAAKNQSAMARIAKAKTIAKKHTESKLAVLNVSQRKTSTTAQPAASAGQGQ